ncbi:MAG: M23 family metallopeptidase [Candidatus Latescibacterota bacterium]|jgi:murein DD-endopeptidase MepM/ murein hydrolase activator NlpD
MKDKYFNFLYIPGNNAEPKQFRIRRALVYTALSSIALALLIATWAVVEYSGQIKKTYRLASLEKENAQLKERLDDFSEDVVVLQRQVAQNFDFQKKARILAQLEEMSDDVTEVGIGGPDYSYIQSVTYLDPESKKKVLSLHEDTDKLLRQARLQRDVYQSIVTNLEDASDLQQHTPSLRPVNVGFVSSYFGRRMDPISGRRSVHRGVDFSARKGTPVIAPADGVVNFSGRWKTYGNVVEISHGYGFVTRYAHLEKQLVRKGQRVKRGDVIARVGSSGKSTFSHLHYEVVVDGRRVNPLNYIVAR